MRSTWPRTGYSNPGLQTDPLLKAGVRRSPATSSEVKYCAKFSRLAAARPPSEPGRSVVSPNDLMSRRVSNHSIGVIESMTPSCELDSKCSSGPSFLRLEPESSLLHLVGQLVWSEGSLLFGSWGCIQPGFKRSVNNTNFNPDGWTTLGKISPTCPADRTMSPRSQEGGSRPSTNIALQSQLQSFQSSSHVSLSKRRSTRGGRSNLYASGVREEGIGRGLAGVTAGHRVAPGCRIQPATVVQCACRARRSCTQGLRTTHLNARGGL
jgi:hypothetical protein